jgi:hypothetical protein
MELEDEAAGSQLHAGTAQCVHPQLREIGTSKWDGQGQPP